MGIKTAPVPSLAEITPFYHLAGYDGAFERAAHVMHVLAGSGLGLGEVLRDYAHQASQQMTGLSCACVSLAQGQVKEETIAVLETVYTVLSSAATVLDMTPAAMLRNKAETVGSKEKISREEIARIARAFREAPEIQSLMESYEASISLLHKALAGQGGGAIPAMLNMAMARHAAIAG